MVWSASSACGVSSEHLNYKKHSMVRAVYRFHVYYHVRRVLKRLQVRLPHEASFKGADNPYTKEEFFTGSYEVQGRKIVLDLTARSWVAGRLHWSRLNDPLDNREI